MAPKIMMIVLMQFLIVISLRATVSAAAVLTSNASNLFREYIGSEFNGVTFSDVPINPGVQFHFILSFADDYTADGNSSTDGHFRVFWDAKKLSPAHVAAIKQRKSNVRVALSLGGDTVRNNRIFFNPSSVDSWVTNAVNTLTKIIQEYHLDGVDIDYEHFRTDPDTFAECIGRLVRALKKHGVISFASIAPFDDVKVQKHYHALWSKYGSVIDYVNFQFYAYDSGTTVAQFLGYFEKQSVVYHGGRVLASFGTGSKSGGLSPSNGFFFACRRLKEEGKLHGIVVWNADDSKKYGFRYELTAQKLLAA